MSERPPILRAGLTGGIASGKSTVAAILAEHGAFVLDADRIAHDLIHTTGAAYDEVVRRFGSTIVRDDGTIDRAALGKIVFGDADARRELEAMLHPRVDTEIDRRLEAYLAGGGHATVGVVDAALLVESGIWRRMHRLIVVSCSRDAQLRRLLARGLSPEDAIARIDAQAPLEDKLAVASYVVDTETTLHETRAQVDRVWRALREDFDRTFGEPGAPPA